MTDSTLLVISVFGVPPYSARGLTQTLEPIDAATSMRRTINGVLRDLSQTQFQKFKSTITCNDQDAPALEGIWPGMEVVVDCVSELCYPTDSRTPERTVVSGSSRTQGSFTFYRPQLTMKVVKYQTNTDEWGAAVGWSLELEEE